MSNLKVFILISCEEEFRVTIKTHDICNCYKYHAYFMSHGCVNYTYITMLLQIIYTLLLTVHF